MSSYTNVTFDEIQVGRSEQVTRQISRTDVDALALVTGDVDSFQIQGVGEMEPINSAEAVGAEVLITNFLNRRLPGPGTTLVSQSFKFSGRIAVGDTLTGTVTAREKRADTKEVVFDCSCVNQQGEEILSGSVTVIAPTRRIAYGDITPPELVLRRHDAFARLIKACERIPPVTCAVVHPCDRDSLLGPLEAAKRKLIEPVLVGPEAKIRAVAEAENVDLSPYRIISTEHSHAAAQEAVALARSGEVEALMKGSLHTDELMAAVVPTATGLRTARRISHVFIMDVPSYPRMLLVTDAAVNIFPTLEDKVDIVQNAIELAHVLGVPEPRVAILSAVETVTTKIPSTTEAAALCKMADRKQIVGGLLDGPLAFDNAISEEAARIKKIKSPVAGRADILLVPDLESGNMVAKQLQYLAGAESAGIVLGTRVPIVLTSRADTVRTRLTSTAVLALVAHYRRTGEIVVKPHA